MNIVVSIIIPIYNVEPYILCCLQSVANQTLTEGVECIVVDDCGKDNSMGLAEKFVDNYHGNIEFKIIHHEYNQGLSAARNTGIDASHGEYLFFLDSDDEITSDCISSLLKIADKFNADLVQGTYLGNFRVLSSFSGGMPEFSDSKAFIKRTMLDYDLFPVMAQNRLVRKDVIVGNNLFFKEGIIHEDNHWTFFLAKYIERLAVCSKPTYYYRLTPGSITNRINISKEIKSFCEIIHDFCENMDLYLLGAQKKSVLYLLNIAFNRHYYLDDDGRDLFMLLYVRCSLLEKFALRSWFSMRNHKAIKSKLFNLCIRLFKMNDQK